MKVVLIRPKPDSETIGLQNVMICEPLELEYLSAMLEAHGHRVWIVDMILERKPLADFLRQLDPDLVGITGYITHVQVMKDYAAIVKRVKPTCKVVVGGVHAEVVPEDFRDVSIDYIVQGNPLKTIREVADYLEHTDVVAGAQKNIYAEIAGIWSEQYPHCQKETSFAYPMPDRIKVAQYRARYYYMFHNPCALIKTSFGCPYQCKFCFCRMITDGKYFTRDLADVVAEIKTIPEREIYIVDDDFLVDRERILAFCALLKAEKQEKKFLLYGRADFIAANEDVIAEFARCGLRAVIVGLESCSEEDLRKYNKKSSVEVNEKAVRILQKYGVECYATLILGLDWTDTDFKNLYRWLRKLDLKFVNLQPFTPVPGTSLYDEYQERLIVPREDYPKWDLAHLTVKPGRMSQARYYWNIVKLYYKITMHPKNVWKMVKAYGLKENLKLSLGASKITWQYLMKIWKALRVGD